MLSSLTRSYGRDQTVSYVVSAGALALVYFLLALFSLAVSRSEGGIALLWLPDSVAIAWLYHRARDHFGSHVLAIFCANVLANMAFESSLLYAVGYGLAHLIEIILMVLLVRRMDIIADQLSVRDALSIVSALVLVAAPLSAVFGATLAWLEYSGIWYRLLLDWWLGDVIGAGLLLLPAMSLTHSQRAHLFSLREMLKMGLIVLSLLLISLAVIRFLPFPMVYLIMPLMAVAIIKGMLSSALAANIVYLLLSVGVFTGWWSLEVFQQMNDLRGVWTACAAVVFAPVMMGIAVDEIRLRQSDMELLTERMELASKNIALGLWDWDLKRQTLYWDERMKSLYGLAPGDRELSPDQWRLRVHPDDRDGAEDALVDALEGKSGYNVHFRIANSDGSYRALQATGMVVRDRVGDPVRMVGMNWDITELVSAQLAVQSAQARLNSVVEAASEFSIVSTNTEGVIEVFSKGAELMLGFSKTELVGRKTPMVFHDIDEVEKLSEILSQEAGYPVTGFDVFIHKARQGVIESREWTYIRKDGKRIPVSLVVNPILESGVITGYLGVARNITQQKKNEYEIKAAHNVLEQQIRMAQQMRDEFESLFELAPGALLVLDELGIVVNANSRAHEQFGYTDASMRGKRVTSFIPDVEESELVVKKYQQAIASNTTGNVVLQGRRANDTLFLASVEFSPLLINGVLHTIVNVHDITAQKEVEQALQRSRDLAESANRAKTGFLANMSHEIRTPLNAVLGAAQLLDYTALDRQQAKYVSMISAAGQALLAVLNDVLDVSKIEAGKMELAHNPFRLSAVLEPLATIMSANAAKKNLELIISVDPAVPRHFIGDPVRIQQVLVNLTGNAIKFTRDGEVVVDIRVVSSANHHVTLELAVRDTGIGMTEEQKSRLFHAFSQGDSSITRRFGGTGLGLTICQKLVEMMGGRIDLRSDEGQGTEFTCTINLEYMDKQPAPPLTGNLRVLLVDANETSQRSISRYLVNWQWKVDVVNRVDHALERLQSSGESGYDVMVFNQNVGGADRLDEIAERMACVKLVNTLAREDFLQQQMAAGKLILLSKPVTASGLYDGVVEARARFDRELLKPAQSIKADYPLRPRFQGTRILLVEDNQLNQTIALGVLEQTDARMEVVSNGEEAIQMIQAAAKPFDLILMDVQMPVMDGFTATRIIREQLGLDLPIIAMTAGVLAFERQQCIESGMTDFIGKPINVDSMLATIARYLPGRINALAPDRPAKVAGSTIPAATPAMEGIFDPEKILKFVRGKPAREQEVLAMIERIVADGLNPLHLGRQLLTDGQLEEARRHFHSLKGSMGNFGAKGVFDAAQTLELAIGQEDVDQIEALLKALENALKQMLDVAADWLKTYPQSSNLVPDPVS